MSFRQIVAELQKRGIRTKRGGAVDRHQSPQRAAALGRVIGYCAIARGIRSSAE